MSFRLKNVKEVITLTFYASTFSKLSCRAYTTLWKKVCHAKRLILLPPLTPDSVFRPHIPQNSASAVCLDFRFPPQKISGFPISASQKEVISAFRHPKNPPPKIGCPRITLVKNIHAAMSHSHGGKAKVISSYKVFQC